MTPLGIALTVALAICGVVAYAAIALFLWGVLAALFEKRGYNIRSKYAHEEVVNPKENVPKGG